MAKYLISVSETYRADTEAEAAQLIEEAKNSKEFVLIKYNCEHKERKAKGEVIDEWYRTVLTKGFTEEKEPGTQVTVSYSVPNSFSFDEEM